MSGHFSKCLSHQPFGKAHKGCASPWLLLPALCTQEILNWNIVLFYSSHFHTITTHALSPGIVC